MKKIKVFVILLAVLLSACGPKAPTWQEQYDLGIRYLEEGNYEEAIIAFTAAIEIDPKRAPAYVGRGSAYLLSGDTEENLAAAQADFEKAIELDDTLIAAYQGLADLYIRRGDFNKTPDIFDKISELKETNKAVTKQDSMIEFDPFMHRSNFISSSDFSPEQQEILSQLIAALTSNDFETAVKSVAEMGDQISSFSSQVSNGICTKYDDYKVFLGSATFGFGLQIRTESGMGYHCEIHPEEGLGGQTVYRYFSGECRDWNYNGRCQLIMGYLQKSELEVLARIQLTEKNSLLDGRPKDLESGRYYGNYIDGKSSTELVDVDVVGSHFVYYSSYEDFLEDSYW